MSEDEKSTAERIKELKRKDKEGDNRIDFKVYNMPVDLVQRFISRAKLYYDNEVWRVLKKADKLLTEEETSRTDKMEKRIDALEAEIAKLRQMQEVSANEDEKSELKPTLGKKNDKKNDDGGD